MSDLKAEYEKLVAGMNPQGYIYRYADGIREGTNGRSINGGYPLETIRYYLAPAIVELLLAIEEEYQKSGALSRLLAAEREKIIVALYEEQNINAVQLQAAIRCIRAFGEPRQGPCTAHVEKARDKIRSFTPPLIDLRDKLRLVEARQKEAVWWAGADWNRPIHQSNRLAELDSEASTLLQQIAELEGKS